MRHLDHVGVAVPDLDAALKLWKALLGEEPVIEDVEGQKVRTATFPSGIELLAPLSAASPISRFLDKRGAGIHHVTLRVQDLDAELKRLKDAGVRLINEEPVPGAGGCRIAFVHPKATGGVLLELAEHE
ncbi:MAG: methylmalonyl-CoA epimerase [Planctomycetota bacterium]|nr:methylmalonyl-CoA epimerase [Planctomycetota bacterium]